MAGEFNLSGVGRVRARRLGLERVGGMAEAIRPLAVSMNTRRRAVGSAAEAWDAVVEVGLKEAGVLVGVRRGVLIVHVADGGARYLLDRWLRSGGESALVRASGGRILRVRLVASG